MNQSVKIKEADYKKLKLVAEKTHRTITGTISWLIDTSGLFKDLESKPPKVIR